MCWSMCRCATPAVLVMIDRPGYLSCSPRSSRLKGRVAPLLGWLLGLQPQTTTPWFSSAPQSAPGKNSAIQSAEKKLLTVPRGLFCGAKHCVVTRCGCEPNSPSRTSALKLSHSNQHVMFLPLFICVYVTTRRNQIKTPGPILNIYQRSEGHNCTRPKPYFSPAGLEIGRIKTRLIISYDQDVCQKKYILIYGEPYHGGRIKSRTIFCVKYKPMLSADTNVGSPALHIASVPSHRF